MSQNFCTPWGSNLLRILSLSYLLLPAVVGCDVLSECVTDEDYELNPNCEDPERGHITGQIALPAAGASSASTTNVASAMIDDKRVAIHEALRDAVKANGGMRTTPTVNGPAFEKLRFEQGDANFQQPSRRTPVWRDGEVIIRGVFSVRDQKIDWANLLEGTLPPDHEVVIDLCNTDTVCLARVRHDDGKPVPASLIPGIVTRFQTLDVVKYAEPNLILQMSKAPNDDYYAFQWHYSAMKLPAAWDITTGSDDVVAAVIDTGIILNHPDLASRITGSVDLIDDADTANDGDGRDNNGDDSGDNSCGNGCHSHHGSHVAGTMGAVTNNANMVAGVSWAGQLLAVRVLGQGGGTLFDIAGGVVWSVGTAVDGVAQNPNPADVLNLSLGGAGESQAIADAIQDAVDAGAIVLVAAGNENDNASGYTPANVAVAITVAAIGNTGGSRTIPQRAPYSNFGDVVDIAAPGGDQSVDLDQDGQADGVLSTVGTDVEFLQGTSMATPHVAGLAMLMKSLNPSLTQAQADAALKDAVTAIDCTKGCGAGGVDAAKTLLTLQGRENEAYVVANPAVTRVGRSDKDAIVTFENVGGASADTTLSVGGPNRDQVTLSVASGTIAAGESLRVDVTIDRSGDDEGEATITAAYAGAVIEAQIIWNADVILVAKSVAVGAVTIDEETGDVSVERVVVTTDIEDYQYKLFNLTPGEYIVIGLSDDDGDEELEENEGIGVYPSIQEPVYITVEADTTVVDVDFIVAPGFDVPEDVGDGAGDVGDGCASSADCLGGLYCEPGFVGGYCTADCSVSDDACPVGSTCWVLGDGEYYVCLKNCAGNGECRVDEGYVCDADATCFPG